MRLIHNDLAAPVSPETAAASASSLAMTPRDASPETIATLMRKGRRLRAEAVRDMFWGAAPGA